LAAIPGAKPSTLCEFCGSELRRASGENDSISCIPKNYAKENPNES